MIASGTRLGSYRVDSLVGQGGMGEVYRGVDTRLDRVVAIKVLPEHLASSPQLRERFEREARAISALTHPHICTLYDVGRENETEYLVMEFVEGESLADRLGRGPLPTEHVIRYGSEIAEALAAAHRQGIVHRDLKPGNIMLTKSGAKLLDFGLAKTAAAAVATLDASRTEQHPLTAEGTLLGTFQYMAPEQVEGLEADARTDIFTLGAVLYEMVTGKRAFEGKSKASLIASILDREPPPIPASERATPPALDRLIRACLAKDPDERIQSARDVAIGLRWISEREEGPRSRTSILWPAIALAASLAVLAAAWMAARRDQPVRPAHLALLPPDGSTFEQAEISPQGTIAFIATKGPERTLYVRRLDEPAPRALAKMRGRGAPFWSPDGKWLAYFEGASLWKIPETGGTPEVIADSSYGFGGAWAPDGRIIFTPAFYQPLHVVGAEGGKARPLTRLDLKRDEAAHGWPLVLPDGKGILFVIVFKKGARIAHVPMEGGEPTDVIDADALVGYDDPYLLFARNGDIYAIRFDPDAVRVSGQAKRVVEKVAYTAGDSKAWASVSGDGILLYAPRAAQKRRFVWYDRQGKALRTAFEEDDATSPRLSPDGKRVLVTKDVVETGNTAVYRIDLERGTRTNLTPRPRFGFNAIWLPDGETIAFTSSFNTADYDLMVQADDPQAQPALLWEARTDDKEALSVAPDGKHLLAREFTRANFYDIHLVPLDGKSPRKALISTPADDAWADLSPDGKWIAWSSNAAGDYEVFVRALAGGRSEQVSNTGGLVPRWSPDGREIFYLTQEKVLMSARFSATPAGPQVGVPEALFRLQPRASNRWELSRDGREFLVNELADTASAVQPFNVVTGWKEALER